MTYLSLPTFGYHLSTPHVAAHNPGTSTIDIRAKVAMDNWVPSGNCFLLAKWGSTSQYVLYIDNTGSVQSAWINAASVGQFCGSGAVTGLAGGAVKWIRCVMNPGAGTCDFYTGDDGSAWTTFGTGVTGKTTTAVVVPGTPPVLSAGETDTGTAQWLGKIYHTQLLIGGAMVSDMNYELLAGGLTGTTVVASTGETWTLANSAITVAEPASAFRGRSSRR